MNVASATVPVDTPADAGTSLDLADLWDRHGQSMYVLACALLGDEAAASRAVRLAMADYTWSTRDHLPGRARRSLAQHVHRHAEDLAGGRSTSATLPPIMAWVSRLARLQRASLALCTFGGLTHREAAAVLCVPPAAVADLLTASLRELAAIAGQAATG